jgi:type IV pilus assembly protein PilW
MNASTLLRHPSAACRERGVSLVEFLVAIAIGLVLVAGLALLYANSSQGGTELDKSIRQIENGRYAVDRLVEDVRMAGYYGELPPGSMAYVPAAVCATSLAQLGWDNSAPAAPVFVTGLNAAEAAALACLPNIKPNTPAIVLRRLEATAIAPAAAASGAVYVQTSRCNSDPVATPFVASAAAADFTLHDKNCTSINQVRRYITRVYYVASCDECGSDTTPTLKRAELSGASIQVFPLAEGIEDLAFEYGFDTDGDGVPDAFNTGLSGVAGAADNDWGNVVALRLYVMSRTTEPSPGYVDRKSYALGLAGARGPFNDGYKRRVYSITSRLNNPAGARESS